MLGKYHKRGDVSIVLLVMLILVLFASAIFSFIWNSGKIQAKISTSENVDNVLAKKEKVDFYLNEISERAFLKSYFDFVNSKNYMKTQVVNPEGYYEFRDLNNNLNEEFSSKIKENLFLEIEKYHLFLEIDKYDVEELKEIKNENVQIIPKEDHFEINFKGFEVSDMNEAYVVKYNFDSSFNVSYSDLNLNSFEEIYSVKENCKTKTTVEEMKTCFANGLNGFDSAVTQKTNSKDENYFVVKLTSKKKFFLDKAEIVEIEFIPK